MLHSVFPKLYYSKAVRAALQPFLLSLKGVGSKLVCTLLITVCYKILAIYFVKSYSIYFDE